VSSLETTTYTQYVLHHLISCFCPRFLSSRLEFQGGREHLHLPGTIDSAHVSDTATVQLLQGTYQGGKKGNVNYYLRILYAQPYERFQAPKPFQKVENDKVIQATGWGPICPQNPARLEHVNGPMPKPPDAGEPDEIHCGVLSVYQPQSASRDSEARLPVVVFAHGGAFITGGSQMSWYDGSAFAEDGEIIVVTINYRLGVFVFLYNEEQDLQPGMADVVAAYEWVRYNIAHFGGGMYPSSLPSQLCHVTRY
jgi:para-nitrobenzyl esterase